jgi:hypothetical protein
LRECKKWARSHENSAPEGQPAHPGLAFGKPLPILVPDPDAEDGG